MDRNKRFVLGFFACFLLFLALAAGTVFVLDPFFHYHAPLDRPAPGLCQRAVSGGRHCGAFRLRQPGGGYLCHRQFPCQLV